MDDPRALSLGLFRSVSIKTRLSVKSVLFYSQGLGYEDKMFVQYSTSYAVYVNSFSEHQPLELFILIYILCELDF